MMHLSSCSASSDDAPDPLQLFVEREDRQCHLNDAPEPLQHQLFVEHKDRQHHLDNVPELLYHRLIVEGRGENMAPKQTKMKKETHNPAAAKLS